MSQVWPGATIGILGGGQLARMMALEARRMGYRVAVLDPDQEGSAAQVADVCIAGAFDDLAAAEALAELSDVITLDTEHVPAELLARLETKKPVRPGADVLRIVQDRGEQRRFLDTVQAPQTKHAQVSDLNSLQTAATVVGFPSVLKTRRSGYDGKGQIKVYRLEDLEDAWERLGHAPCLLEAFVDFEKEVSILLARDLAGNMRFYPVAENHHRHHVLHTTRVPGRISNELAAEAEKLGARIAEALGHVGMMAVELFVTREDRLLVNEIAPRPHNSGHYTFGACATSQFEQHVRAICGLPLGDPSLLHPAAMMNLLGDHWKSGSPDWQAVLSCPSARLHLYGKRSPSAGRKMGHVLVIDDCDQRAMDALEAIERRLDEAAPGRG